jgi:hypothetical protein
LTDSLVLALGQNQQAQSKFCLNALVVAVEVAEEFLLPLVPPCLEVLEVGLVVTQGYW